MSCRVIDETYVKVKGEWVYFYRAVDKYGNTIDFKLSEKRDEAAARKFFQKAINHNEVPDRVVIDKKWSEFCRLEQVKC
jgi:putative transposase